MRPVGGLLLNKNFLRLWGSQLLSQLTINLLSFLILTRIFDITGSTIATSLVWLAYALPAIIVGPLGAVTADMVDRRKMLMSATMLQGIAIILYSLLYRRHLFLSYAIVFIYSLINQFYVPSEAAVLPKIVKTKHLPMANSLFFITQQSALTIGFVIAGVLYDILPYGRTLFFSGIILFLAMLCVSFLPRQLAAHKLPHNFEAGVAKFFGELIEGYQFIKSNPKIFFPFILLIALPVTLSIIIVSLPSIATEILKIRANLASVAIIIPAGAGALTGTVLCTKLLSERLRKRHIIEGAIAVFSIAILLLGLLVPQLPFWAGRTLAVVIFFIVGASYVCAFIPSLTHLQEKTPTDFMGRVFGNIWFITTIATVLPVLFSATIAEIFGIRLMLGIFGSIGIIALISDRIFNKNEKSYKNHRA